MIKRIKSFLWVFTAVAFLMVLSNESYARGDGNPAQQISLAKSANGAVQTASNIGNWGYWFKNDGTSANDPFTGGSGGYYPVGTAGAIYRDGLVWGGIVDDPSSGTKLRVGGNTYSVGTQPGVIGGDPNNSRIYRIRSDWATLVPSMVIADAAMLNGVSQGQVTEAMANEVIANYKSDWKNWPVDLGAPYYDVDGDGTYNPVLDENGMPDPKLGDYPGIANADQVLWFAINDMNEGNTTSLSGSPPIGLEVQTTVWAYNQPGAALGQLVFKKYKIINKSGFKIDSMYVCQWADPDLGDYGDDLTGCDTDLSLMFAYNGGPHDSQYDGFGLAPAAIGYDFFQGPIVASPGDTAVFDLEKVPDHKNLPMTSYGYFGSGTKWSDPTMGNYDGTLQWYNLLRGYAPTVDIDNPTSFVHTTGDNVDQPTKFPLDGDPVAGSGDIDGVRYQPGDRRMLQSTGPFNMENGDVQEVVVSVIGGLGNDNISSLNVLKNTDEVAQILYNDLFKTVPKAPPAPALTITPFEEGISLEWGSDHDAVAATEAKNPVTGYDFEGYNVYQLPSASATLDQAKLIAVYDLVDGVTTIKANVFLPEYGEKVEVPVRFGKDTGIKRYFFVDKDYLTNKPLYRGTTYYFAVTAYSYNPAPTLIEAKSLESAAVAYSVTVQGPKPGNRYNSEPGEEIEVNKTGNGDGSVKVSVVDPTQTTGHDYKVVFVVDEDTNSATYGKTFWNLVDVTDNKTVLKKQDQLAPTDDGKAAPIVDGLQVKVYGPPMGINPYRYGKAYGEGSPASKAYLTGWDFSGPRWISGRDKGWTGLFGGLGNGEDWLGTSLTNPLDYMDVDIEFAGYSGHADTTLTIQEVMANSKSENPDRWSKAVSYDGWKTWSPRLADAPFAAYDVESTPRRRLKILFIEDGAGDLIWDMGWNPATQEFAEDGGYEYILILNEDYDETYTDIINDGSIFARYYPVLYTISPNARGSHPYLEGEFTLNIFASNVNTPNDEFSFSAPGPTYSDDLAKADVEKINVFPNPYYAANPLETSRFSRFVTFNHLPKNVDIRIFNLSGVQVRSLTKTDDSQFYRWDLKNERGLPVASGVYIVHLDMPDLGKEKVLKVFIVQAQEYLEFY